MFLIFDSILIGSWKRGHNREQQFSAGVDSSVSYTEFKITWVAIEKECKNWNAQRKLFLQELE
jgi:hypothetical protein